VLVSVGGGNGEGGWIWCKYSVYMYVNGKMIPVETVPEIGGGRDEGEWWKGWIQVQYTWYIIRTFVNGTMYPYPAQ
jgi:hypothetical protein